MRYLVLSPLSMLLFLSYFGALFQVSAAQIEVPRSDDCTLELQGQISAGDAERFSKAVGEIDGPLDIDAAGIVSNRTLCLSSVGGNYSEALKIIEQFPTNLKTVVKRGEKCYSACALIFLVGNRDKGVGYGLAPDRWLSATGELGFHAPFVASQASGEISKAFAAGVKAVAKLVGEQAKAYGDLFFPPTLIAKMLEAGPSDFFKIETVAQAIIWDIRLLDLAIEPSTVTTCMVARACLNYTWGREVGDLFDHDDGTEINLFYLPKVKKDSLQKTIKFSKKSHRSVLIVDFQRRGDFKCVVDVIVSATGRLLVDIEHGPANRPLREFEPEGSVENGEAWFGPIAGKSLAYLLSPSSKITDLSRDGRSALACRGHTDHR